MIRFFLAGLATVAGVVLLFVVSFGDLHASWQTVERAFLTQTHHSSGETAGAQPAPQRVATLALQPKPAPTAATPPKRDATTPEADATVPPKSVAATPPQPAAAMQPRSQVENPETQAERHQQQSLQQEIRRLHARLSAADSSMAALHDQEQSQQQQLALLQQQHTADESQVAQLKKQQAAAAAAAEQAKAQRQAAAQQLKQAREQQEAAQHAEQLARQRQQQQASAREKAERVAAAAAAEQAKAQQQAAAQQLRQAKQRRQAAEHAEQLAQQQRAIAREKTERAAAAAAAARQPQRLAAQRQSDALSAVLARLHREVGPRPAQPTNPQAAALPALAAPNPPPITPSRERLGRARAAIERGHLQQAQQLLEEAQLQLVFRPVSPGGAQEPSGSQAASDVAQALSMLGTGHRNAALRYIDRAMAENGASPQQASLAPPQYGQPYTASAPGGPPRGYRRY